MEEIPSSRPGRCPGLFVPWPFRPFSLGTSLIVFVAKVAVKSVCLLEKVAVNSVVVFVNHGLFCICAAGNHQDKALSHEAGLGHRTHQGNNHSCSSQSKAEKICMVFPSIRNSDKVNVFPPRIPIK